MKQIRNLVFAIVLVLTGAAAQAQSKAVANIPFNFQVGDRQMTAGHYSADVNRTIVLLRGEGRAVMAPANMAQDKKASQREQCKLVFRRSGGAFYLAEIWSPALDTVARLKAPKHAQILARNAVPAGPDEIVIYAQFSR